MRVLPSGTTALLVELDSLDEVLALHATLVERRLEGVVDIVPAARTVLLVTGEVVDIPVIYDGADLEEVAELVWRHTAHEWTVAFCGFSRIRSRRPGPDRVGVHCDDVSQRDGDPEDFATLHKYGGWWRSQ